MEEGGEAEELYSSTQPGAREISFKPHSYRKVADDPKGRYSTKIDFIQLDREEKKRKE